MNFLFFSLPLISNRNERKAKRENEKKIFSFFFLPYSLDQSEKIFDPLYRIYLINERHLLIDFYQQFLSFLFFPFCRHALASFSFLYTQNNRRSIIFTPLTHDLETFCKNCAIDDYCASKIIPITLNWISRNFTLTKKINDAPNAIQK